MCRSEMISPEHLEFTRDIAERMNNQFGQELFQIPMPVKEQHEFFGNRSGTAHSRFAEPTQKDE